MDKNQQNDSLPDSSESFCGVSEIEAIDAVPRSGQLPLFEALLPWWGSRRNPTPLRTEALKQLVRPI